MGKNHIVLVKEHQGLTAADYFRQIEKQGFRVDKIELFSIHHPDEMDAPQFERKLSLGDIMKIMTDYNEFMKKAIWVNNKKVLVLPVVTTKDPNPD